MAGLRSTLFSLFKIFGGIFRSNEFIDLHGEVSCILDRLIKHLLWCSFSFLPRIHWYVFFRGPLLILSLWGLWIPWLMGLKTHHFKKHVTYLSLKILHLSLILGLIFLFSLISSSIIRFFLLVFYTRWVLTLNNFLWVSLSWFFNIVHHIVDEHLRSWIQFIFILNVLSFSVVSVFVRIHTVVLVQNHFSLRAFHNLHIDAVSIFRRAFVVKKTP